MKTHLGKKAAALLLVLSLAVSLLSVVAIAEEPAPGTEGTTSTSESTPTETNSDSTSMTQTTPDSTPAADNALSEEQPAPEQPVAEAPSGPSAQVDTCEDGQHQPDLTRKQEATYTTCSGGYKVDTYPCTVCGALVDADGHFVEYFYGDGKHKPGSTPRPANYTECNGGYQTDTYRCAVCGRYGLNADGSVAPYVEGTGKHTPGSVKQLPTFTSCGGGYKTEWYYCTACNLAVNADGTLTPVSPEDFPAEGVTVVIPYPAGTDQSYTFVISHMITSGPRAGQIEILRGVNTESGICVHFTSMSPVCISYARTADTPAPAPTPAPTPTPAAPVSTVPKTSDANHGAPWGMLVVLSLGGLGALALGGKKLLALR